MCVKHVAQRQLRGHQGAARLGARHVPNERARERFSEGPPVRVRCPFAELQLPGEQHVKHLEPEAARPRPVARATPHA